MSCKVNRYDLIISSAGNHMEKRKDGDWVEFDDYERLEAINAELLAACEDAKRMYGELNELALKRQPAMVPVTIVQRLNSAIDKAKGKQ